MRPKAWATTIMHSKPMRTLFHPPVKSVRKHVGEGGKIGDRRGKRREEKEGKQEELKEDKKGERKEEIKRRQENGGN